MRLWVHPTRDTKHACIYLQGKRHLLGAWIYRGAIGQVEDRTLQEFVQVPTTNTFTTKHQPKADPKRRTGA